MQLALSLLLPYWTINGILFCPLLSRCSFLCSRHWQYLCLFSRGLMMLLFALPACSIRLCMLGTYYIYTYV